MYTVAEVLREKGSSVLTIGPDATVLDAAHMMNEARVGSLIVATGEARDGELEACIRGPAVSGLAGILTERDLLMRVLAAERDPKATRVSQVMTSRVLTCQPTTPLEEIRNVMRDERIRHMPVLDGGWIVGMLSIGDLNIAETVTLTHTIETLEAYIAGG
ncbi:MAG: CBS domain-containing protein [Planctomycetota bacterium]